MAQPSMVINIGHTAKTRTNDLPLRMLNVDTSSSNDSGPSGCLKPVHEQPDFAHALHRKAAGPLKSIAVLIFCSAENPLQLPIGISPTWAFHAAKYPDGPRENRRYSQFAP
jgi:hypothetical protein